MSTSPQRRILIAITALVILLGMVAVPVLARAPGNARAADDDVKNFTIIHTNDAHSDVIPYDLAVDYPDNPTTGGFSRLAKTIMDIKKAKAAAGEPVLTLDAADWSQGTLFSWLETATAPELVLMQQIGYDATTIGNHDIELGPQYLEATLNAAKAAGVNLPLVSSNIIFSGYPPDPASADFGLYTDFYSATDKQRSDLYIQPYTTRVLPNGLKVGIFGLLGVEAELVAPGMTPLSFGNMKDDPTSSGSFIYRVYQSQQMINTLKSKNCDVIVCLSHMGTSEEKELARIVPDIDVVIGGHSHDLNYPPIIYGTGDTIIVQAKAYTEYLGNLELQYDPTASKVTVRNANITHMDQSVGEVPAVNAVVDNFLAGINAHLGFDCLAPFAETDFKGDGGFDLMAGPAMSETNLGNLITDTYLAAMNQVDPAHPTRLAFESNGVIRSSIPKGASGVFSFYDLYRALPLGGSPYDPLTPGYPLVSFYLAGAEIQGVMNQLIEMNTNDFFVQISGMKYTYDPNGPKGEKVLGLTVDDGTGVYEPVNPGDLYKLVTNYYTGSFLTFFGLYPRDETGAQHKPPAFPDPMKEFIVHNAPGVELKAWQALSASVQGMPDLDGDGLPNIPRTYYPTQGRITEISTSFYLAEGTCRPNFEPYIAIQNPGDENASVTITYMKGDRTTDTQDLTVPGNSRFTVTVKDKLGEGDDPAHDFSAAVECTNSQEIICERPMYFDYQGAWTGGSAVVGATSPATTFYFAEGTCRPGFEPYLCIQNPGDEDASVLITYMKGDGSNETQGITVAKESRYTVAVKDTLGEGDDAAHDFSAKVEVTGTDDPEIICERPMYFDYKGAWTGGSDVVGATSPATTFYFAEGTCRPGFDPYLTIQNPIGVDAPVEITYMKGDGTTEAQALTVPKYSRSTVVVKETLGEGDDAAHDFSAAVECTNGQMIICERPMYFDYHGAWTGGTCVVGYTR